MVSARLHIICGNCGTDDMFKYKVNPEHKDEPPYSVSIACGNCVTIHDLKDNAKNSDETLEEVEGSDDRGCVPEDQPGKG